MIKVKINKSWIILSIEPVEYKEVILDFDITDNIVVCESTGNICKLQDSEQGKNRLIELQSEKEHSEFEKQELEFLNQKLPWNVQININNNVSKKVKSK